MQLNIKKKKLLKNWTENLNIHFSKECIQITNRYILVISLTNNITTIEKPTKTTKRYHFISVRMAALKRQQHVLERMWKKGTLAHCWWECKLMPPLWKQHRASFKNEKNRITIWSSNPTPTLRKQKLKKAHVSHYALKHYLQ